MGEEWRCCSINSITVFTAQLIFRYLQQTVEKSEI